MTRLRVASLVSGGKDSLFASFVALQRGWDVTHYVTIEPQGDHPYLYHKPNVAWVELQARCAGVPFVRATAPVEPERELEGLRNALSGLDVDGVTSGALASEYQRVRIDRICHELGLRSFAPLWHHDRLAHLRDLVSAGIQAVFVHVSAAGMEKDWLGRRLDSASVADLARLHETHGVDPAGEGGEYETFVLDAPQFSQSVQIDESEAFWRRDSGTLTIRKARLAFKTRATPLHTAT